MSTSEPRTRQAVVRHAAAALAAAGIEDALTDARLLVAHALGIDRVALVTGQDIAVLADDCAAIDRFVQRRLGREPVSRIIGVRWFRGRPFRLSAATLDPRPDSETLIDAALAFVDQRGLRHAPLRVLDVGTGTGCLLLTLLAELPRATGVGVDLAPTAIATAAANATDLGIGLDRVDFVTGDGPAVAAGCFNIIVSNPPYIPACDIDGLDPEVRLFDPRLALDGGHDGLDFYRTWTRLMAQQIDKTRAFIGMEVGVGQAAVVAAELAAAWPAHREISLHRDLGGIDRCVSAATRS